MNPLKPTDLFRSTENHLASLPNFLCGRSFYLSFSDCQNFYKNLTEEKGTQAIPYIDRLNLSRMRLFEIEITREIWHTASLEIGQNKVFVIWSWDSGQVSPVEKERDKEIDSYRYSLQKWPVFVISHAAPRHHSCFSSFSFVCKQCLWAVFVVRKRKLRDMRFLLAQTRQMNEMR